MTDIRNAKAQEEEDKRVQAEIVNIQRQFADHQHLSGYQRKKYICKLLYIYLLGHSKVEFGFMESIELLSSNVFSEKQIGYMAVQFFISNNQDLLLTVINSLRHDLESNNTDFVCLALHCIATLGEQTIADNLIDDVFKILRSPTLEPLLKKKASLALLKLIQVSPYLILDRNQSWISRLIAFMDDEDLGFAQSVTSTVTFVAYQDPKLCAQCIPSVTKRLSALIIEEKCSPDYLYYGIPAPWFTVKLLNLIELLIADTTEVEIDNVSLTSLKRIVSTAIAKSIDKRNVNKQQQFKNAQSSVLFSAISLGARLDPSSEATSDAINALGELTFSTETNTRYLALDALIKVTSRGGPSAVSATYGHLSKILALLKDRDISIRRKSLDLLYTICDSSSVENICSELLAYLSQSDYLMRGEIAIKIAVLAEKYATEATWYITTSIKLISLAGLQLADEVWERTIQIIVNNEKIQPLALRTVIRQLKMKNFPESIVKISSFLIGEYGYLVDSTVPPDTQFELLIDKYYFCSFLTRNMLLSCFLKMYIRYETLRPQIMDIFQSETLSTDSEIQQRAVEYLRLVSRDDGLMLAKEVVQQLPPFLNNVSPLISRLGNVKDAKDFAKDSSVSAKISKMPLPLPPMPRRARAPTNTSLKSLTPQLTSDSSSRFSAYFTQSSTDNLTFSNTSNDLRSVTPIDEFKKNALYLSSGWEEGYYRLIHFDQGIFFENSLLKIIYRCKKDKNRLHFQLTYSNKSPVALTGFNVSVASYPGLDSPYAISTSEIPETHIAVLGKSTHVFDCIIRSVFDDTQVPLLNISFMSGTLTQLRLRLPIVLMKSLNLAPISSAQDFFRRWQQIGLLGAEGETQRIFTVGHRHNHVSLVRLVERLGFSVLENVDNNLDNVVSAGILRTLKGNSGCLMRLEPDDQGRQFRLTLRCTAPGVSKILTSTMVDLFEHGF